MEKIKVLELIDSGYLGGGQKNVLSIANNVYNELFDISIAAPAGGKFELEARKNKLAFYNIELPKVLRNKYLKHLITLQQLNRFDIVHSHGGIAGFYSRVMKRRLRSFKTVHSIHGIHYVNYDSFIIKHLSMSVDQYLVQFTDMTICENEPDYMKALEIKIADPEKTVIIPNGINTIQYKRRTGNPEFRKELGLSENDFVIGNISRFDIQKNQKIIVQAAYYLVKKYPDMKFVFVGDGKNFSRTKDFVFESGIEKNFIFTGEVTNIKEYYSLFDVFVFPTLWEGMPYVILEAMASGLPIICSNIPSLAEVVKDDYSALMIDPLEAEDLLTKLVILYENRELREYISENAYMEAKKFDEKDTVKKIEQVYTGVMVT